MEIGKDISVGDWKAYSGSVFKKTGTWHFQFQKSKKIILTRHTAGDTVLVRGESLYNSDSGKAESICKKRKSLKSGVIAPVQKGVQINSAKVPKFRILKGC